MDDLDELKKLKCELCGNEEILLIQVQIAGDSMLTFNKGICYSCFKEGELDTKLLFKSERLIKDRIRSSEDRTKDWKRQLIKIQELKTLKEQK